MCDSTTFECSICLESLSVSEKITFCENSHSSCKSCYELWRKKCLETHAEITCPTCRNMTLSCLVCRKDFPSEKLKRPCVSKNHYYCNDCFTKGIRRFNHMKLDTPCILCAKPIHKYIHGTYGPELPPNMLNKYNDKSIEIDNMLDKLTEIMIQIIDYSPLLYQEPVQPVQTE